jgi:hypothetical protein
MEKRRRKDSAVLPTEGNGNGNEIIVRPLKTWYKPFPPFSFMIESEEIDGAERLSVSFNLNPPQVDDKQTRVWSVIRRDFSDNREFCRGDIESLCPGISPAYIKKLLAEWTCFGRIERLGSNRDTRYRFAGSLAEGKPLAESYASIPVGAAEQDAAACGSCDIDPLRSELGDGDRIITEYPVEIQHLEGNNDEQVFTG